MKTLKEFYYDSEEIDGVDVIFDTNENLYMISVGNNLSKDYSLEELTNIIHNIYLELLSHA